MGRPRSQRGAVGLVVIVFVMAAALVAAVVVTTVQSAVAAGRAQNGADAVALAAAAGADAGAVASANRVQVETIVQRGNCVEVKVRYGRQTARARAQFDYPWPDRPTC